MPVVIQLPKDINRFCRTCMNVTEENADSLENYIVHDNQSTSLCNILESVTSLNVTAADGLPATLCSQCTEHLTAAYAFINQCKDVDTNLRNLLKLSDNSEDKVDIFNELDNFSSVKSTDPIEFPHNGCQICGDTFSSHYNLSMHMIKHNADKTLLERFLDNQSEDSKSALHSTNSINYDADTIHIIKTRKLSRNSKTFYTDSEIPEKRTNATMDVDVPLSNNLCMSSNIPIVDFQFSAEKKSNNAEIQCKACDKMFKTHKELISHVCKPQINSKVNGKILTSCSLCNETFKDTSSLSLHFLKHALLSPDVVNPNIETEFFFCEVCGETFDSESFLLNHYNEKHEGKPSWLCSHCPDIYERESDLLKHNVLHVDEENFNTLKEFSCVLCNTIFTSRKDLLKHSIEHLMKKYSCKKCLISFCTQHAYFAHLASHAALQYLCPDCGKILSTKSALKSHIIGVHSVDLKHTCSTCGKSFATASRLKTHSQIHKITKKYICSYCGYSTHKAGDLQMHTRVHTSERPYKCTFANCTASFKTSSHLCDHVRRHMQIRKFKCGICSVGFSTKHGLKVHHMQHTGERPHTCLVCNQRFRRKYHVKVHMKQHEPKLN